MLEKLNRLFFMVIVITEKDRPAWAAAAGVSEGQSTGPHPAPQRNKRSAWGARVLSW